MALRPLLVALALVPLINHPALAQDTRERTGDRTRERVLTLTVEAPSFVSFQREVVVPIPSGSKIRFRLGERSSDGTIPFTITPDDVQIRAFDLGRSGARGRYELAAATSGTMTRSSEGLRIEFPATIRAVTLHADGSRSSNEYPVEFTTEQSMGFSENLEKTVTVRGRRFDEDSRQAQIVLATMNRGDKGPVPGAAVFAKITGTFDRTTAEVPRAPMTG